MYCIKNNAIICLRELFRRGINLYAIRNDIDTFIKSGTICSTECVRFALENMYNIEMLTEPIQKYFLIGLVQFAESVPKEIFIYIMQLYMDLDYAHTNTLYQILFIIEDEQNQMSRVD